MQILGDIILGAIVILAGYRMFLRFGGWVERRSEKAIEETKKESQKNG